MLGVDIVQNSRIEKALRRFGDRFLRRVFTDEEISYCRSRKDTVPCLSVRWACKEAVFKAFYQEFGVRLRFADVEIVGDPGEPARVVIKRSEVCKMLRGRRVLVSVSHEREYSVAVALIL